MPEAVVDLPSSWDGAATAQHDAPSEDVQAPWWTRIGDPAVEVFIQAAEAGHPSLQSVVARIEEARAGVALQAAAGRPTMGVGATAARGRSTSDGADGMAVLGRSASVSLNVDWELDLFGRIRAAKSAASHRLNARDHEARQTRLSLSYEVAAATIALRSCRNLERIQQEDEQARLFSHEVVNKRVQAGLAEPLERQREFSRLAMSRVELANRQQECSRLVNKLAALTGMDSARIQTLMVSKEVAAPDLLDPGRPDAWPRIVMPVPATVLLRHPTVLSAMSEMEAAWSDIDTARAARWPRINLVGQLSRSWLSAAGSSSALTPWLIGPSVLGTLFDGGAAAAGISAAEARYQGALAHLNDTLRQSVEEIENSLAAIKFAHHRATASKQSLGSAAAVLRAMEQRQATGSASQLEREDARMQYLGAQLAAVSAVRDRTLAWTALVRASGNAEILEEEIK
jgi:multidrug efflux system outer membrane protein